MKKKHARRITSVLLTLLMLAAYAGPALPYSARADTEFVLYLDWNVPETNAARYTDANRRDLELTPPYDSLYPNTSGITPCGVVMNIRVSPPDGVDAQPNEIEVRMPMYIFEARPQATWSSPPTDAEKYTVTAALNTSRIEHDIMPEPARDGNGDYLPGDQTGLYYELDNVNKEVVFRNWRRLTGGSTTVINVRFSYIPDKIANGYTNSFSATANFTPGGQYSQENSKTSAPLSVKLNTFVAPPVDFAVRYYRPSDETLFKYESWQTSPNWGAKPAGSVFTAMDVDDGLYLGDGKYLTYDDIGNEKYYYLIWEVRYQRRAVRSTQPHYVDIDIELSEAGGGEIMGICGNDVFNNADPGMSNLPFVGQAAAQINAATATIAPSGKTANINLLHTPSAFDARSDSYYNFLYRWVLVRYPRGEGPGYGYNVDTDLKATLTLTGIDEIGDPGEGKGSDPEERETWVAGELGAVAKPATPTLGYGAYTGDPKYTHTRTAAGKPYNYAPVVHNTGGLGYRTLEYHIANYANNSVFPLYSAINKLSEGSVTNPVSIPILRMPNEAYTFRLRTEAEGYYLTRAEPDKINTDIDNEDPRNYYAKDYTVEIIDGENKFLRGVPLTKDDYSITKTYVTYTEYIETFNPNSGRLTAQMSTNFDGDHPAAGKAYDKGYAPVEIWYKTVFNNEWAKAGEVMRTGPATVYAVGDISYGMNGIYYFTSTDGTQLQNPGAPMNASNQLMLPRGTYEVKYIHTNSRFRVDVTPYFTVELNSTNRVRALLDGGVVDGASYARVDTATLHDIHSFAVIDSQGTVRNTVPYNTIYASSWPGATGVTEAVSQYQRAAMERSHELYGTPYANYDPGSATAPAYTATDRSVQQHYTYINLNRTTATTVIDKINTADRHDASNPRNGYYTDSTVTNDGVNALKSIHQSVRVYENIYYNPALVPGATREEKLEDLADNKIFRQLTEGTFYDLLPPGTYIDEDGVEAFTFYLDPYVTQGNATVEAHARAAHEANRQVALQSWYTIDNWQGSGRTMLVVNVKAPGPENYQVYDAQPGTKWTSPSGAVYEAQAANTGRSDYRIAVNSAGYERILSGFVINYNLVTTYANIFDRSDNAGNFNAYNVVAYRNRNSMTLANGGTLASGTTVPASAPWNYNAGGAFTATGGISTVAPATRSFFTHLEVEPSSGGVTRPQDDGNHDTVYASLTTAFSNPTSYTYGVSKHVRSQSDPDFVQEAETVPGGEYSYQLHFLSAPVNIFSDVKIYDILEGDDAGDWKGTLVSVDVSYAVSQGCAPVVYYSTAPPGDLKFLSDPEFGVFKLTEQAKFDAELDGVPIWTTQIPADRSAITAIAVDFSKATNGTDFKLQKGESIYAVVNMRAPTDPLVYQPIIASGLAAVNRIGYFTVETDSYNTSSKKDEVRWSETTYVTMRDVEFDIAKSSFPESGTQADAQAVDKGEIIEYTLAVQNIDVLPLRGVTVVDTLPQGVTLDTSAVRYYTGTDPSRALPLPSWITLTRSDIDSGDGRMLEFAIGEINAQQTISLVIPVKVDEDIAFGTYLPNTASIISVNGADYDVESETTYHQVYPRVTIDGSVALADRHLRAGEFEFVLKKEDGTEISRAVNDKDGAFVFPPLDFKTPGTYTFIVEEASGTVPTGNLPNGAPGTITYDGAKYTVTIVVEEIPGGGMTTETTIELAGGGEADLEFSNDYLPDPVFMPLELSKLQGGRAMKADGEFSFTVVDMTAASPTYGQPVDVYGLDGAAVPAGLISSISGLTEFRLRFTQPGVYTFELRENIPTDGSGLDKVTYDEEVYTITITVGKTSVDPNATPTPLNSALRNDGKLSIDALPVIKNAAGEDARISFTNKYTPAPVTEQLVGTKVLTGGRPLAEEEFEFILTDATDPSAPVELERVKNAADGSIVFSQITYDEADAGTYGKTFTYVISEVDSGDASITYADPITVKVIIGIDRDNGVLSSSVTGVGAGGFVITNKYTPEPVYVSLSATKRLADNAALAAGQFTFDLIDETNPDPNYHRRIERVTNEAGGAVVFSAISYTQPSATPYLYRIEEYKGASPDPTMSYDTAVYHISVMVTQNAFDGKLNAGTPVITGGGPVVFSNYRNYEVDFRMNDGTENTHDTQTVDHGKSVSDAMPAEPVRPGYVFMSWNTLPDGTGDEFSPGTAVTDDVTVYAVWSKVLYNVIYSVGEAGSEHGTWDPGDYNGYGLSYNDLTPSAPDAGVYREDHWIFAGWEPGWSGIVTDVNANLPQDDEIDPVTGVHTRTITYVATWVEEGKHNVIIKPGYHGTFDEAEYRIYNSEDDYDCPELDSVPEGDPGWAFDGWEYSTNAEGYHIYTAKWRQVEYLIAFYDNGGTIEDGDELRTANYEDTLSGKGEMPPDPVLEHYVFMGWNTLPEGNGEPFTGDTLITSSLDLYAQWEGEACTVIYAPGAHGDFTAQSNDARYDDPTPQFRGDPMLLHEPGWSFAGWDVEISDTVTGSVTYTALWDQDEYTIIYDPGEHGKWDPDDYTTAELHYGDPTPAEPEPGLLTHETHYHFVGWDHVWSATVSGTMTYTALWDEDEKYTIAYTPGEHGTFDPAVYQGLYMGEDTPEYAEPEGDPGWEFAGWAPESGRDTDWRAKVDGDEQYVAIWTAIEYTVIYDFGEIGGSGGATTPGLKYGDPTPLPPELPPESDIMPGYEFDGWEPDMYGTVTEDITYAAKWKKISYIVTYNSNGSFDDNQFEEVYYGETTDGVDPPARPGYIFTGWATEYDAEEPDYDGLLPVYGNITVYALWEMEEYTVTFDPGEHGNWDAGDFTFDGFYYDDSMPQPPETGGAQGWAFDGWGVVRDGVITRASIDETVRGNEVYIALWKLNTPPQPPHLPQEQLAAVPTGQDDVDEPKEPFKLEDPVEPEGDGKNGEGTTSEAIETSGEDDELSPEELDGETHHTLNPNLILHEGQGQQEFPGIDFYEHQPDAAPGGKVHEFPPNPRSSEHMISPEHRDDGEVIFVEFDDFDAPLGEWRWDNDSGEWVFEEYPQSETMDAVQDFVDLTDLPQTGVNRALATSLLLAGLSALSFGLLTSLFGVKRRKRG